MHLPHRARIILFSLIAVTAARTASAAPAVEPVDDEPVHAIAMHGEPTLPPGFDHLPYVNPDAPKGGEITYGVVGTFDSLNPFILQSMRTTARGVIDQEFGDLVFESLMYRSRDEPFTLYGLIAETVQWDEDRTYIQFNLNPKARFSDGEKITPEDVIFSFELLAEKGRPPYRNRLDQVESLVKLDEDSVRFTFTEEAGRELPLLIAMSPILPEHATDVENFDRSTLEPMIGSGPYTFGEIEPGRRITYERDPDYWAKYLPIKRGIDNYDTITVEYFLSANAQFEAFKKGIFDVMPEGSPTAWARSYNFPAVEEGKVIKDTFEPGTPSGMYGFVFNTRREIFQDRRVRQALTLLFDFQWVNRTLFDDAYTRTESYWQGSKLSSLGHPAGPIEQELLAPFPDAVRPEVMNGTYRLPTTSGGNDDREIQRAAYELLREAGYRIEDGTMVDAEGRPFVFEVMTQNAGQEKLALAYRRSLAALGITMRVRTVDDAQYQQRSQTYDYDMIMKSYTSSLSPGAEQIWRWHSRSRDVEGTFNYAGAASPALDAMIDAMLNARTEEEFTAAVRAFDRVLLSGVYLVPLYHVEEQWVARWAHIERPEQTPIYGYQLPTWWDARAAAD
jgi:peptide/nickel transport system substrate-binding protein